MPINKSDNRKKGIKKCSLNSKVFNAERLRRSSSNIILKSSNIILKRQFFRKAGGGHYPNPGFPTTGTAFSQFQVPYRTVLSLSL